MWEHAVSRARKQDAIGALAALAVLALSVLIAVSGSGPAEHRLASGSVRVVEAAFAGARRPNSADPVIPLERQRGAFRGRARQVHATVPREDLPRERLVLYLPETGGRSEVFVNSVTVERSVSDLEVAAPRILASVPDGLLIDGSNRFDLRVEPDLRPLRRADVGPVYLGPAERVVVRARRAQGLDHSLRAAGGVAAFLCALGWVLSVRQSRQMAAGLLVLGLGALCWTLGWPAMVWALTGGAGFAMLALLPGRDGTAHLLRGTAVVGAVASGLALARDVLPVWQPSWEPLGLGTASASMLGASATGAMVLVAQVAGARERIRATTARLAEQARTISEQEGAIREAVARRAVLEERQRFTRDMHDGVGAQLTSLLVRLRAGRADLSTVETDLQQGLADLRLMVDSLDSVGSDFGSALQAFRARAEQQARAAGMDLGWEQSSSLAEHTLDERDLLHIYRFLQEALTNAIRHSGGERITISIAGNPTGLALRVEDDGGGFDPARSRRGRGLRSLGERAEALGGALDIRSAPGEGTEVELRMPLHV